MPSLLVKNIHTLVTHDAERREIRNGALLAQDGVIEQVGTTAELVGNPMLMADEVLDLGDRHIVLPGLVNTHHHFYQCLTRVIPGAQNGTLFDWLTTLYPIWANLTPEAIHISTQMAIAELMLSGCTTASDHLYIFPNGCTLDDEIRAAQEMGLRFHPCRGSMSVGKSQGGLPPDSVVESEAAILQDSQRLIEQYHDNERYAMLRIVLAPCSPFSVSPDLMRESAALARSYAGVRLHTHLAENKSDVDYSLNTFGMLPGDYAESVGWLGSDVWHAHCVQLDERAIAQFAETGTGVSHCPSSNTRLASGIAPIRAMLDQGVPVSLGVDGSASNDTGNLLQEARLAFLLARVRGNLAADMTAREILEVATLGGARVLGRADIGAIAPGMAADFIAINLDRPQFAGALHDPVSALVFCQCDRVDYSFINGKKVVDRGRLVPVDLETLAEKTNQIACQLTDASLG
ncbi:8-oxoguanine deaminase [Thermoleptolyngbya sichuanensis A183]|uniref:8-oxoguanine deaminase n=1 Tax=Thermoleptolyngbya sichuanensis A183 TaxID=2737172 RepID=A0A6M8BCU5_9CYAN|nr:MULTISPECIES: 8-oxoguanine deaminase [Thermoleptolyngbya]QKD81103.1 8-oxoguanine deaminase [Thermoleptolyngbya sichuanensis A183]